MFLDRLRKTLSGMCDHSNESYYVQIREDGDRVLCCWECQKQISLRVYLSDILSSHAALKIAEEYVKWSGDDQIPCSFSTFLLRNRALTTEILTNYYTLAQGCMLLRIVHAPFTAVKEPTPSGIHFFLKTVQTELDRLIERSSREKDDFFGKNIGLIAHNSLVCVRNIFAVESKRYFDVLASYVKLIDPVRIPNFSEHKNVSLFSALPNILYESSVLHRKIGKRCVAFDAVHVATLCFLCRDDMSLVYDLVLDFVGKLCSGYFYKNMFSNFEPIENKNSVAAEVKILTLFKRHLSPTLNTRFYQHLELFSKGGFELADCFSETFFKTYWELKLAIVNELDENEKCHFEWVFPCILFRNYSDYYAFLVALSYYSAEMKATSKTIDEIRAGRPGLISECKSIYRFVKISLSRVKAFHEILIEYQLQRKELKVYDRDIFELFLDDDIQLEEKRYYWSRNMLKCFFRCYPQSEKKWADASEWLVNLPLYDNNDPDFEGKPISFVKEIVSEYDRGVPYKASFETIYERYMKKREDVIESGTVEMQETCTEV